MPQIRLDVNDAGELAEMLESLSQWLGSDPALQASLSRWIGHPGYGIAQLRQDLDRFTFLLGGHDGEHWLTTGNPGGGLTSGACGSGDARLDTGPLAGGRQRPEKGGADQDPARRQSRVGWAARCGPGSPTVNQACSGRPPSKPSMHLSAHWALQRFTPRSQRGSRGSSHGMPRRPPASCAAFLP